MMADEDEVEKEEAENAEGAEGADGEEGEGEAPKKSKKKLIILVVILLLVVGGGGAGFMLMSGGEPAEGEGVEGAEQVEEEKAPETFVFYDLPDILVNLALEGGGKSFLKISVSLELADELDVPKLEKLEPRIVDKFQVYLRGLSVDDLQGTEGVYRLREELLARVNATVKPIKVSQILFKEILVQ